MATLVNAVSVFANVFVLWMALIVIAASAFFTVLRTGRRDRHGLVDPTAVSAIGTVLSGPIMAAFIAFIPRPMVVSPGNVDTHLVSGSLTAQAADAWVWVATAVVIFWMYALASTIVVTSMYFLQQRRLRHHA